MDIMCPLEKFILTETMALVTKLAVLLEGCPAKMAVGT